MPESSLNLMIFRLRLIRLDDEVNLMSRAHGLANGDLIALAGDMVAARYGGHDRNRVWGECWKKTLFQVVG